MKRAIRRALREWKEEFARNWAKLNTFMRIVLGIVIAMLIISSGRRWALDPLQDELAEAKKANQVVNMPDGIIRPENDPEVTQLKLKAESLEKSLARARASVKTAASGADVVSPEREIEVLSALDSLISESGLLLQSRVGIEDGPELPVAASTHHYTVIGTFAGLHGFLHQLDGFSYLSSFGAIELGAALDSNGQPRRSLLQLKFEGTFYYFK